jgi:hypothetical protein
MMALTLATLLGSFNYKNRKNQGNVGYKKVMSRKKLLDTRPCNAQVYMWNNIVIMRWLKPWGSQGDMGSEVVSPACNG